MREATLQEILEVANTLKYLSCLDLDTIIDGVVEFYGDKAARVSFCFGDEYNDQDYDLRVTDFTVFDSDGTELGAPKDEDAYYDFIYNLSPDMPGSSEGDSSSQTFELDIVTRTLISPQIPKLYFHE